MVRRLWVDGWWMGGLLMDSLSGPSSECKCWLILLGVIGRVVFELGTWWAPNIGVNSGGLFIPKHEGGW
jgi:hypothetical protein